MEAHSVPRSGGLSLPRSRRLLTPLGDDRLVEQVRRGNDAAFEVIFDRHHRGVLSFCRHMLASVEEAEDAVQHTFIQAYDAIRRSDREIKLKAWLYAIARNRCLSVLRARREQAAELDEIPTAGLSEEVQQRHELRDLLGDIQGLPEDQRAALVLSELGDLSHAEIAGVVGCEASKVKSLVFQARSTLIETRNARAIPCHEIREQLATASGGALRRGPLRKHVKHCEGCAEFRDAVARQRKAIAALLPVVPTAALKHGALAAVGGGASAAGGGLAGALGTTTAGKALTALAVSAAAVGGGVAITEQVTHRGSSAPPPAKAPESASPAATKRTGIAALVGHPHPARQGAAAPGRHAAQGEPAKGHRAHGHRSPGSPHGHKGDAKLPQNHGTQIAPGLNGTAGQGQPDGVGKNHGIDNGRHNGAANGHANGRSSRPPGHVSNPATSPKEPSAAAPALPEVPAVDPPSTGPAADAPGKRLGNKHTP